MFRIGKSSTHGVGWFATCDIPANAPIWDEEVSIRMLDVDLSRDSGNPELLQELVSRLPEDQKSSLYALCGDDLLDKLWMNGSPLIDFGKDPLGIGPRKGIGIYLQSARINHSCAPNAVRVSDKGNIMSVVSQKGIASGDEITISYMDDNFMVSEDRERQMRSKIRVGKTWKGCRCALCNGPEHLKRASDERRRNLFLYRERLLQGSLSKAALQQAFLPLMAAEGLPASLMGAKAMIKMTNLLLGIDITAASRETLDAVNFSEGARVRLHKLRAKPELNGKMATVVYPINAKTGRVGILLEQDTCKSLSEKPIAVKPENLCIA